MICNVSLRMFRVLGSLAFLTARMTMGQPLPASDPGGPAVAEVDLGREIARLTGQPRFAQATWGIQIESLDTGHLLFATNAHHLLQPASNAKLFTGALALERLGPDFRIRTSLRARRPADHRGVIRGDLVIQGRGDFSFAARFHQGNGARSFDRLVEAFKTAGIRRVTGDLVGDATAFEAAPWGRGWTWNDLQHYYGAAVSALTAEDNTLDLVLQPGSRPGQPCRIFLHPPTDYVPFENRTTTGAAGSLRRIDILSLPDQPRVLVTGQLPAQGSNWVDAVAVQRPALWFLHLLRQRLRQEGIRVGGGLRTLEWPVSRTDRSESLDLPEISGTDSPPLHDLVAMTLKPSQNQYAQLLLLQVGRQATEAARTNALLPEVGFSFATETAGLLELRRFIEQLGIPPGEVRLDDGAGLSRTARVTPAAIVTLLKGMDRHPHAAAFRAALPLAGVDGTLKQRLQRTAAAGNLRAKTGTLSGVYSLSGYVTNAARRRLVFSLMVNQHPGGPAAGREDLDQLATLLAESR